MPASSPVLGLGGALAALLRQLPQAQAVALMGFDGLPVVLQEAGASDDTLATALGAYAQAMMAVRGANADAAPWGTPDELVLHSEHKTVLLRPVHRDYYLAVVQAPQAPIGRARFYVQQALPAVLAEL